MPQERIQETRRLSEEIIIIIRQTNAKSPEQLIETLEEILRRLKMEERINKDKIGMEMAETSQKFFSFPIS